jgi:hypothetical protein
MGMFDKPQYLTGDQGYAQPGDTFFIHNARIDGTVNVGGQQREQAKLAVSREKDGPSEIVYTSGTGIVAQIRRMDSQDRAGFPLHVRLDQIPSQKGNPTNVLTPADQPEPTAGAFAGGDDIGF